MSEWPYIRQYEQYFAFFLCAFLRLSWRGMLWNALSAAEPRGFWLALCSLDPCLFRHTARCSSVPHPGNLHTAQGDQMQMRLRHDCVVRCTDGDMHPVQCYTHLPGCSVTLSSLKSSVWPEAAQSAGMPSSFSCQAVPSAFPTSSAGTPNAAVLPPIPGSALS